MIDTCSFGSIVVDGKKYTTDLKRGLEHVFI